MFEILMLFLSSMLEMPEIKTAQNIVRGCRFAILNNKQTVVINSHVSKGTLSILVFSYFMTKINAYSFNEVIGKNANQ